MATTISANNGAGTSSPLTALSPYASTRTGRNVIHDLIGGDIAVSLVSPRPRSGTIEYLFDNEQDAFDCLTLHGEETSFTLTADLSTVSMTYVVDGSGVTIRLDEQSLRAWIVAVGYQAVG